MVICQGCGQAFDLPAGYTRTKIQCPGCGVICPVPAGGSATPTAKAKPTAAASRPAGASLGRSVEDEAAAWLTTPDSAPAPRETATPFDSPPPRAEPPRPRKQEARIHCRRCGRAILKQRECPDCDDTAESLPVEPTAAVGLAPHSLELDEPEPASQDEDASPYILADKLGPTCPKCSKEMTPGAVLCAACGFNLRTRKKAARTYEPMARSWESDLSMGARLGWFAVAQAVHGVLALLAGMDGYGKPFLVAWPLLALLLCFVLGTYDRITITRDVRGRVMLVVRWRFCWIPLAPQETEVRGFEGVLTGTWSATNMFDWLVFGSLLFMAILPGLIWWYVAMYRPQFHVALAQDHGHAEVYVYRGRSEAQMHDIAETLCNVAGLKLVN